MGFKFRLERVLDFKETVEELKKSEYSLILQELRIEEEKLESLNSKKDDIVKQRESSNIKTIFSLQIYNDYLNNIVEKIELQKEVVDLLIIKAEKAKKILIEAMQEKKAFEKLKENDYDEYLIEEKRKEDKLIDQIVTFKTRAH